MVRENHERRVAKLSECIGAIPSAWPEPVTVKVRRWLGRHRMLATGVATSVAVALVGLTIATVLLNAAKDRETLAKLDAAANLSIARTLDRIRHFRPEMAEGYSPRVAPKERWLDPLVRTDGGVERLSVLDARG